MTGDPADRLGYALVWGKHVKLKDEQIYYYTDYNNQPKRHYTPKQWLYVGIASLAIVFLITLVFAFVMQKPGNVEGLFMLELKLALANTLYAAGFYFLTSAIWCNIPQLPTNAYRFFKL